MARTLRPRSLQILNREASRLFLAPYVVPSSRATPLHHDHQWPPDANWPSRQRNAYKSMAVDLCRALSINDDAAAREAIAIRIVELARRGERNHDKLRDRLLRGANNVTGM